MNRWITLIGIFKLIKAALLLVVGVGVISLLHKDVQEVVTHRILQLGFDPEHRFIRNLIAKAGIASPQRIAELSIGAFIYAGLFSVEGIGLILQKRWAEYLTTIITGSFLPLELYELSRHFTIVKTIVILLNIAIVIYLIIQLRKKSDAHQPHVSD